MPPARYDNQDRAPHDHSLLTIAPTETNAMIDAGQAPRPNSCAGITGCHDAGVPGSGTPYDFANTADNDTLQAFYDAIGVVPDRGR